MCANEEAVAVIDGISDDLRGRRPGRKTSSTTARCPQPELTPRIGSPVDGQEALKQSLHPWQTNYPYEMATIALNALSTACTDKTHAVCFHWQ